MAAAARHHRVLDLARHAMTISVAVNDGAVVALRRTVRLSGERAP